MDDVQSGEAHIRVRLSSATDACHRSQNTVFHGFRASGIFCVCGSNVSSEQPKRGAPQSRHGGSPMRGVGRCCHLGDTAKELRPAGGQPVAVTQRNVRDVVQCKAAWRARLQCACTSVFLAHNTIRECQP